MFIDTACIVMDEILTAILDMLVFISSRFYGLFQKALSLMQPHRKKYGHEKSSKRGGHYCFAVI
jgi:cytoplasmic iron level regulating protein YaaA (DUF328/UPF0246 family)